MRVFFNTGFLKKESSPLHHPGGLDAAVQLSTSALKGEGEMATAGTAGGGGHGAAVPRGTCLEEKPFSIISTQNLMMSVCVVSSCAFPRCFCICLKRKKINDSLQKHQALSLVFSPLFTKRSRMFVFPYQKQDLMLLLRVSHTQRSAVSLVYIAKCWKKSL